MKVRAAIERGSTLQSRPLSGYSIAARICAAIPLGQSPRSGQPRHLRVAAGQPFASWAAPVVARGFRRAFPNRESATPSRSTKIRRAVRFRATVASRRRPVPVAPALQPGHSSSSSQLHRRNLGVICAHCTVRNDHRIRPRGVTGSVRRRRPSRYGTASTEAARGGRMRKTGRRPR